MNIQKNFRSNLKLEEIKIELSYFCNLRCVHCSSEGDNDKKELISYNKACEIINDAIECGVRTVSLSGGEPFLWQNLEKLVKFIQSKGKILTKIYTCGASDNFQKLLDKFKPDNLKFIFSLYSYNETLHENITCIKGSFNKTISSIKKCTQSGFKSELHFVPLKSNYKELEKIAKFSKSCGIDKISVLRFVPQGRGKKNYNLILNIEENLELKNKILSLRKQGFFIRTGSPFNFLCLENQPFCTSGFNKLIIAPNLSIYPCDAFKQINSDLFFKNDVYNSLKTNKLIDCWSNSKYLNAVRNIIKSGYVEPCISCPKINQCRSGCLAQKVIRHNSFDGGIDPSCLLRKNNKEF